MPIRKLSTLLINQIAAGEVIERPASVVKELVENSLDAGATRIDLAIEEGGTQLIRISDNGSGIPADELPLALAPHATSKLQSPEQLAAVATLGFRGEALASIASVSRLRLTSRATLDGKPAESGAAIESSGEDQGQVIPVACSPGTVIEVRDLFFNTPARRKFMRAAPVEFGHIAEIVSRIAMGRPDVGFTLTHNGRKTLEALAGQDKRTRCVEILGKELDEALMEFDSPARNDSASPIAVWGLAGQPSIARATAKFQYLYVNGRPIRDRNLTHALREAYRGLTPPDRQPVAVAFIWMDPEAVDVNVHPTKAEVRFLEPGRVHGALLSAVRQRLLGSDLTPRTHLPLSELRLAALGEPQESAMAQAPSAAAIAQPGPAATFDSIAPAAPMAGFAPSAAGGGAAFAPSRPVDDRDIRPPWTSGADLAPPSTSFAPAPAGPAPTMSTDAFVNFFRRMDPRQKGFAYEQVRAAMAEDPRVEPPAPPPAAPRPAADEPTLVHPVLRAAGVLQVHNSYLVTQDDQGLLIVDQHALHERIMFEELRQRLIGPDARLESQRLLMPEVIPASARRLSMLDELAPLLERLGIEASPLGPSTLGVQAFPSLLFDRGVEPGPFMTELLDRAEEGELDVKNPGASEAALHEVLDMMACKAAVKAGDRMKPEELASLLARREEIDRASNCPHGRPTTIRLTLRDLEKHFKRG